jgi:hypothetical protein
LPVPLFTCSIDMLDGQTRSSAWCDREALLDAAKALWDQRTARQDAMRVRLDTMKARSAERRARSEAISARQDATRASMDATRALSNKRRARQEVMRVQLDQRARRKAMIARCTESIRRGGEQQRYVSLLFVPNVLIFRSQGFNLIVSVLQLFIR